MSIRAQQAAFVESASASDGLPHAGIPRERLIRVGRGAYVLASEWDALFSEGRMRTRTYAAARRQRTPVGVWSHASAASLHALPLFKVRSDRVEMIVPGLNGRRNGPDLVRHHVALPANDIVVIDGLKVTSLDRTAYDLIRAVSLDAAVASFDAALHRVAWDEETNRYDVDAAERFRDLVRRRVAANPGARGIRQARFVVEFGDGRAQSPGESIARLWMWQLSVPVPVLQHRVDFPDGTYALLDFSWPEMGRWAEFDGLVKYMDAEILAGRTAEQVLEAQDRREQKVRAATGWDCDRWGFERMQTIDDFAQHLRAIGLRGVGAPGWPDFSPKRP
jgi:hypothetical protein